MFLHVSVILFTGGVSQHALQVVSQHAFQQVSRGVSQHALQVSRPTPRGEVEGSGWGGLQARPKGKLRGLAWGGLQAHTWGSGVFRPTPRGVFRQTPGGSPGPHLGRCIPACTEADPPDGYCCGRGASYWNAFLFSGKVYLPQIIPPPGQCS